MIFGELNNSNFLLFAIKNYENPQALTENDFYDDLKRFKYLKRLINKHLNGSELNVDLILNHTIILYNVFGDATTPMLFFKIEKELWSAMKSFIVFLGRFPEYPHSDIHDIQVDMLCLTELYKIYNAKQGN